MVDDGEVLSARFLPKRRRQVALADTAWASDQAVVVGLGPVARPELEEQAPIETARGMEVDVFEAGVMAQPCGSGAKRARPIPIMETFL